MECIAREYDEKTGRMKKCRKKTVARGLCRKHYQRKYYQENEEQRMKNLEKARRNQKKKRKNI